MIYGGSGNDDLNGGSGDDTFRLTADSKGVDEVRGASGTDTLDASGARVSRLIPDDPSSVELLRISFSCLSVTEGSNRFDLSGISGDKGSTRIDLGGGDDILTGSEIGDEVHGADGSDTLRHPPGPLRG